MAAPGVAGSPATPGYRADIDGLRALAVLAVVLFHARVPGISGGFVGVDIFFVISGYLIGAHVYRQIQERRFSLADFYARRARRILPALFAVFLFCAVVGLLVLYDRELRHFAYNLLAADLFSSNIYLSQRTSYFAGPVDQNPLLMTWSLGVEEQFYLLLPLLLLALAGRGARPAEATRRRTLAAVAVISVASLALSIYGLRVQPDTTFYLLPTRAWELGAGVLMALYELPLTPDSGYGGARWAEARCVLGLAAIVGAVLLYRPATAFPGAAALAPVLGAALILSAPHSLLSRRLLSFPPLRWVGLVSYSWYLWHWPLLSFARLCADHPISLASALLLAAAALGLAALSHRFLEQPFRRIRLSPGGVLPRYAAIIVGFALLAGWLWTCRPERFPAFAAAADISTAAGRPCVADFYGTVPNISPACVPPADGRPAVALLGDSHAGALMSALQPIAARQGLRLETLAHSQCPPLPAMVDSRGDRLKDEACLSFNRSALARVIADPSVHTVILAADWGGPEEWMPPGYGFVRSPGEGVSREQSLVHLQAGLSACVEELQHAGKRVLLLEDIEALTFDPMQRLASLKIPVRGWIARRLQGSIDDDGYARAEEMDLAANRRAAAIVQQVAASTGATLFDLRPGLCAGSRCRYLAGDTLLYFNTNHLTEAGARLALAGLPPLNR